MSSDRDKLIKLVEDGFPKRFEILFREDCEELADYLLANNVKFEKQGKWVSCGLDHNDMEIIKCSECGRKQFGYSKYCANCGAKMKELK